MNESLLKQSGGTYYEEIGYFIPDLRLPAEEEQPPGTWGQGHPDHLKQYRKVTYTNLCNELLSEYGKGTAGVVRMKQQKWLLCPVCGNKTRLKLCEDTVRGKFPLFCPKCRQETLRNVRQMNMSVIREPDAEPVNL